MDAALALGDRDPLHAVYTALELQPRPGRLAGPRGALGLDGDLDILVAAEVGLGRVDDLGAPAALLGIPQIHPQQIAGEQSGFIAALTGLDLQDDVPLVVGVAGYEELAQLLLGALVGGHQVRDLLGEPGILPRQLPGRAQVLARDVPGLVCRHDRPEGGIPAAHVAKARLIADDLGVGELGFQGGVLGE